MAITTIDTFSLGIRINPKEALKGINSIKSKIENLKVKAPKVPAPKIAGGGFSSITNELKKSNFQADALDRRIKKVGISIQKTGRNIQGMGMKLQSIQIPSLVAFGAGTSIFAKATKEASDFGESVNAVNVVFEDGAKKILDFAQSGARAAGFSKTQFNQLATETGALVSATGKGSNEVARITVELAKLAGDTGSVFNKGGDEVLSAINQAIRGETEAIRKYAVDVTDASVQTFLLSKGITTKVSKLSQEEKVLARISILQEKLGKNEGDRERTKDEAANRERDLQIKLDNQLIEVGKRALPIRLKLVNSTIKLIDKFESLSERQKDLVVNGGLAAIALAGIGVVAAPVFIAIGGIVKLFGGLVFAMKGIAKVARFIKIPALFSGGQVARIGLGAAALAGVSRVARVLRAALLGLRLTNPLGWLLLAIEPISKALYGLTKDWDSFKKSVGGAPNMGSRGSLATSSQMAESIAMRNSGQIRVSDSVAETPSLRMAREMAAARAQKNDIKIAVNINGNADLNNVREGVMQGVEQGIQSANAGIVN